MNKVKPISLTFVQLLFTMRSVHGWNKADMARLHDVWLAGAPTPDSRLLNIKDYDPRKVQAGNVEKRLILPPLFAQWFVDVTKRRGINGTPMDAYQALQRVARAKNRVNYERKMLRGDD